MRPRILRRQPQAAPGQLLRLDEIAFFRKQLGQLGDGPEIGRIERHDAAQQRLGRRQAPFDQAEFGQDAERLGAVPVRH